MIGALKLALTFAFPEQTLFGKLIGVVGGLLVTLFITIVFHSHPTIKALFGLIQYPDITRHPKINIHWAHFFALFAFFIIKFTWVRFSTFSAFTMREWQTFGLTAGIITVFTAHLGDQLAERVRERRY